jgi:hypothetical protein
MGALGLTTDWDLPRRLFRHGLYKLLSSVPPPNNHVSTSTMEAIRPALATLRRSAPPRAYRPLYQCLHTSSTRRATPLSHATVPGPPPGKPAPHPSDPLERVARKKRQAELVKQAQEVRSESAPSNKPKSLLKKRFWKDVIVKETDGAWSRKSCRCYSVLMVYRGPAGLPRQPARPQSQQGNSHRPVVEAPACYCHCARVGSPLERPASAQDPLYPHDLARRTRA